MRQSPKPLGPLPNCEFSDIRKVKTLMNETGGDKVGRGCGGITQLRKAQKSATFALSDDREGEGVFTVKLYRKVRLACADGMSARGGFAFPTRACAEIRASAPLGWSTGSPGILRGRSSWVCLETCAHRFEPIKEGSHRRVS